MEKNTRSPHDSELPPLTSWGLYIFVAIGTDELHGYAIRQAIERLTNGEKSPSAASLYENIAKLLDDGFLERAGEKTIGEGKVRKMYRVTGVGARVAAAALREEEQRLARLRGHRPGSRDSAVPAAESVRSWPAGRCSPRRPTPSPGRVLPD